MKKSTKTGLIVAGISLLLGVILIVCSLCAESVDFKNFNTRETYLKEYVISQEFNSLNIDTIDCDIVVCKSADDKTKVACIDSKNLEHSVSVTDGKLKIEQQDNRRWYERIFVIGFAKIYVKVELPKDQYEQMFLKSVSGDVQIQGDFATKGIELYTTSGSIRVSDVKSENLNLKTTSGEIVAFRVDCSNNITMKVTSGDIELTDVVANGKLDLKTVSGDMDLERCDGEELNLKTTSGDIEASLLSSKRFDANAVSGDVHVPTSDPAAGLCMARTTNGDIEIRVIK